MSLDSPEKQVGEQFLSFPGSLFLYPGSLFLYPGSRFLDPGSRFLDPGFWLLIFLVCGSWNHDLSLYCSWFHVLGSWFLVPIV